jgi:hypothetical protein
VAKKKYGQIPRTNLRLVTWQKIYQLSRHFILVFFLLICKLKGSQLVRKGLDARQAAFAVKKYKSHRRIGVTAEVLACINNVTGVPSNILIAA